MIEMFKNPDAIDLQSLKQSARKLETGLIQKSNEKFTYDTVPDKAADPIKSVDDIERITKFLVQEGRYRDNMMFIVGINFGLRVGDLMSLRFANIIDENFTFRETFAVFEQKTRNTRKKKKNRYITINKAVMDAVTLYLSHTPNVSLSDYMFRCQSNRGKNVNKPLSTMSVDRILKGIANDLGLTMKMSSHSLRKTFCYHQMLVSGNDVRKLYLLQKMLGHASIGQTLDYIGITKEEMQEAYLSLNLGSPKPSIMSDTIIIERDAI